MWSLSRERAFVKVILPGEIGFSSGEKIGTFAVGAARGCRGYLAYDSDRSQAGLAHVDFFDQDSLAVETLVNRLSQMGARDIVLGYTPNADLASILSELCLNTHVVTLPVPEFVFDPCYRYLDGYMSGSDKRCAFNQRKSLLTNRLKSRDHSLMWV